MRRSAILLVGVFLSFSTVIALAGSQTTPRSSKAPAHVTVTFTRDIAPILYDHCTACHRPGEIGPMSLITYGDVRPYALLIRYSTMNREMPPWHVFAPKDALTSPRLDERDLAMITKWVDQGTPQGDPKDLPPLPGYLRRRPLKPTE